MNEWVVWFYVEPFTLYLNGQGQTPIHAYCSGSVPGPCPGTGHSQCDYAIWIIGCKQINVLQVGHG